MSTTLKINTAVITVIMSALVTAASVIWMASAKAERIEDHGRRLVHVEAEIIALTRLQQRLDERSLAILKGMEVQDSKLHGISTQIGMLGRKMESD